jgi:hypothetical protein
VQRLRSEEHMVRPRNSDGTTMVGSATIRRLAAICKRVKPPFSIDGHLSQSGLNMYELAAAEGVWQRRGGSPLSQCSPGATAESRGLGRNAKGYAKRYIPQSKYCRPPEISGASSDCIKINKEVLTSKRRAEPARPYNGPSSE